jgi:hypothetical protein
MQPSSSSSASRSSNSSYKATDAAQQQQLCQQKQQQQLSQKQQLYFCLIFSVEYSVLFFKENLIFTVVYIMYIFRTLFKSKFCAVDLCTYNKLALDLQSKR